MMEKYRGFWIYGNALPVTEFLLGRVPQWYTKGSIDYVRPRGSLVELTRFQLPGTKFEEKEIAEWFGLEISRLAVDTCYRDLAIARYETEKRLVMRDRVRH